MGAAWLVGVAINMVGSVLINLGTNIMKLGHNKRAAMKEDVRNRTPVRKVREWQIGVALFSVGNVANFVSFGYAAQSLLSAIGCIQFVSNVFFASFVLKEQVSTPVIVSISCIVGGCILLVSFGSHTSHVYTYKDLLRLYGKPAYVSYMCIGGAVVVLAYMSYCKGLKAVYTNGPRGARLWAAFLPILYCLFSAIIGTQSVLFSKTLAVLLRATVSGDNQLGKWFTWLVLPAFLFTAAFWVTRLNKGLKMFPAMVIVPNLQISWTLFSILSGMLYFQEYQDMKALDAGMFVLGVSVVFAGVFLLTKASVPKGQATSDGYLTTELDKAKIAYIHHEDEDHLAVERAVRGVSVVEKPGFAGLIGTKLAREGSLQLAEHTIGTEEDAPLKQESFLQGSRTLHPRLSPELDLDDDFEPHVGQQEDERSLLGGNSMSSQAVIGPGDRDKPLQRGSFSFSRALAGGLRLGIWPGSSSREGSNSGNEARRVASESRGHGVQVLPDFAVTGTEGAAEATAMQRQHQRRRLRNSVSTLSKRVAHDFDLDETVAARLTLGLGDSSMPGVSLFTMPMIDVHSAPAREMPLQQLQAVATSCTVLAALMCCQQAQPGADRRYGVQADRSQGGVVPHQDGPLLQQAERPSNAGYDDSEGALGEQAAAAIRSLNKEHGMPSTGINPLANAINVSSSHSLTHQAPLDGLLTSVKQNIREIHANIRDLTAGIQTAGSGRNYARVLSKDGMDPVAESKEHSERQSMS